MLELSIPANRKNESRLLKIVVFLNKVFLKKLCRVLQFLGEENAPEMVKIIKKFSERNNTNQDEL